MKPNRIFATLLVATLLAGCAGTNGLKKSLRDKGSTLGYLHDAKPVLSKSVSIAAYQVVPALPPENEVTREKSLVLPLLVYNYWKHDFRIHLGRAGTSQSTLDFGRESLAEDFKKSGAPVQDGGGDFRVSVRVNTLQSETSYYKSGYVVFLLVAYSMGMGYGAREIHSSLDADIFIQHAGRTDSVHYARTEPAEVPASIKRENIPQMTVNAMVETLSLCFQDMNRTIIAEVRKRGG